MPHELQPLNPEIPLEREAALERSDEEILLRVKNLPPTVGATLMFAGVMGVVLPGPMGAPLIVAGGLVLAPEFFSKIDDFAKKKLPSFRSLGLQSLDRFITDFNRRYPAQKDS